MYHLQSLAGGVAAAALDVEEGARRLAVDLAELISAAFKHAEAARLALPGLVGRGIPGLGQVFTVRRAPEVAIT